MPNTDASAPVDEDQQADTFEEPETGADFDTVAAVDLGSNSFHLVVATVGEHGGLTVVDRLKERVRLAAGLDDRGDLSPQAQEAALSALARFGERVANLPQGSVRACGTNTLRKARDVMPFMVRAQAILGHPIEIVAGHEEARLIYQGVAHDQHFPGRQLVIDIGGGSTELIIGEGTEPRRLDSLYMGCVSWSETFFPNGELSTDNFERAITAAKLEVEPIARNYRSRGWRQAVGSSGTVLALQRAVELGGFSRKGITNKALGHVQQALVQAHHVDKVQLAGIKPGRMPVLPGGLAILRAVMDSLGIDHLRTSQAAMREGMLLDLLGRFTDADMREQSVDSLAKRHLVDLEQAGRVATTAHRLLVAASRSWGITAQAWTLRLRWAALLHELGMSVAHTGYHKHGAYLVRHTHLPGCSRQDQEAVAALVLSHRGRLSQERVEAISTGRVKVLMRLAVLLRLAVRLHRSRSTEPPPPIALSVLRKNLHLALPQDWLDAHPMTRADLEQEARQLAVAGFHLTIT